MRWLCHLSCWSWEQALSTGAAFAMGRLPAFQDSEQATPRHRGLRRKAEGVRCAEALGAGSHCVALWPWRSGSASLSLCNFFCKTGNQPKPCQYLVEMTKWARQLPQGLARGAGHQHLLQSRPV